MIIKVTSNSVKRALIYLLTLLMPFHVFIFSILSAKSLALWRDALLLLLVLIILKDGKLKKDACIILYVFRILVCCIFAIFFHGSHISNGVWINVLRVYLFPSLIFFVLIHTEISKIFLLKILKSYMYTAVIVSMFGIIQVLFIGRPYLRLLGVSQASVLLADGTQRNIGLFRSANVMAGYVLFAIVIAYNLEKVLSKKIRLACLSVLLVGLLLTYSMSGFIAFGVIVVLHLLKKSNIQISEKKITKLLVGMAFCLIAIIIVAFNNPELTASIIAQISEKVVDIINVLRGTNSNSTSSAAIHLSDLLYGFSLVENNLNGLGFATESFMVADKISGNIIGAVESSFLTIFIDFGILVGGIYLLLYFVPIFCKFSKTANKSIVAIGKNNMIILMVLFMFLPLIQSYELNFFSFLFVGLMYRYCKYERE